MPPVSADVRISVEAGGSRFTLNACRGLHRRYRLKVGKSWSTKHKSATLTEVFDLARRWAVRRERPYWSRMEVERVILVPLRAKIHETRAARICGWR